MAIPPPAVEDKVRAPKIGGLSALKGLILYGATLMFAGLYIYFIVRILAASPSSRPELDPALVKAAAALAGVLGSAFALEIGIPTEERSTNSGLRKAIDAADEGDGRRRNRALARVWRLLSLEPSDTQSASWPKTFGIWVYAIVAGIVALTYILAPSQTPDAIKALAIAFGGYIIALINTAYGLVTK
jgi:hypothetical protein